MIEAFFSVIFIVSLYSNEILGSETPKLVHSTSFQDVRENKRLNGSVINSSTVTSQTKCGLGCNRNEDCRLFNFCYNGT